METDYIERPRVTGSLPRQIEQGPYRFDDPTWLDAPVSIAGRSQAARPTESAAFWAGLLRKEVVFDRCLACRRYTHFPVGTCQWCGGAVAPEPVDATATINTFAPSYLEFAPGMTTPYCAAIVNPVCEPGIQLMTDIVNCRISDVRIGMTVGPLIVADSDRALLFYQPQ